MLRTALFAAAGLAAVTAAPVMAHGHEDAPVSKAISFADLDLTTEDGQERLQRRLEIAAENACHTSSNVTLRERAKEAQCLKVARASGERQYQIALAKAQRPQLAANNVAAARP